MLPAAAKCRSALDQFPIGTSRLDDCKNTLNGLKCKVILEFHSYLELIRCYLLEFNDDAGISN